MRASRFIVLAAAAAMLPGITTIHQPVPPPGEQPRQPRRSHKDSHANARATARRLRQMERIAARGALKEAKP